MNSYVDEVVRKKIDAIEAGNNVYEMGRVRNVQSYMLEISGMENAAYFDRVIIENADVGQVAEGYVDRIGRDSVTVALTRKDGRILVGDEAVCTGKEFTMQFAPQSIGHVVDMFGRDLMVGERFSELMELPVE